VPRHLRDGPALDGSENLCGDAVIFATGGNGAIFWAVDEFGGLHRISASRALSAGRGLRNGEFIQVHPTAIPGEDKLRLMSESARGEGGRVWVPRNPGRSARREHS